MKVRSTPPNYTQYRCRGLKSLPRHLHLSLLHPTPSPSPITTAPTTSLSPTKSTQCPASAGLASKDTLQRGSLPFGGYIRMERLLKPIIGSLALCWGHRSRDLDPFSFRNSRSFSTDPTASGGLPHCLSTSGFIEPRAPGEHLTTTLAAARPHPVKPNRVHAQPNNLSGQAARRCFKAVSPR